MLPSPKGPRRAVQLLGMYQAESVSEIPFRVVGFSGVMHASALGMINNSRHSWVVSQPSALTYPSGSPGCLLRSA